MSWVKAKPGESFESLMRRFKKAVENSGVLADSRKNEFYEKPSVKRKKKSAAARKRVAKELKKTSRKPKASGQNFKWSKDHTKKIPLPAPKPYNKFKPREKTGTTSSNTRYNTGVTGNKPTSGPRERTNSNYKGRSDNTRTTSKPPRFDKEKT